MSQTGSSHTSTISWIPGPFNSLNQQVGVGVPSHTHHCTEGWRMEPNRDKIHKTGEKVNTTHSALKNSVNSILYTQVKLFTFVSLHTSTHLYQPVKSYPW